MRIAVECHGVFRGLCGPELTLDLPGSRATVAEALRALAVQVPEAAAYLDRTACAVGDELVGRDRGLTDGDRVALIPPVSGG